MRTKFYHNRLGFVEYMTKTFKANTWYRLQPHRIWRL